MIRTESRSVRCCVRCTRIDVRCIGSDVVPFVAKERRDGVHSDNRRFGFKGLVGWYLQQQRPALSLTSAVMKKVTEIVFTHISTMPHSN